MPVPWGRLDERIAVGKVTVHQTTILLDIFDRGMEGQLLDPRSGKTISADAFARSLKIGVMHHYLFEPPDAKAEPLLRLKERRREIQRRLYPFLRSTRMAPRVCLSSMSTTSWLARVRRESCELRIHGCT